MSTVKIKHTKYARLACFTWSLSRIGSLYFGITIHGIWIPGHSISRWSHFSYFHYAFVGRGGFSYKLFILAYQVSIK